MELRCVALGRYAESMPASILLLDQRPNVTVDELHALHDGAIIASDCYVVGAEDWEAVPGGLARGRIVNVDHHASRCAQDLHIL